VQFSYSFQGQISNPIFAAMTSYVPLEKILDKKVVGVAYEFKG
jgi:hypothetical protein